MPTTELPSKLVESATALTEEKMRVSFGLIKISYEKEISIQEIIKNYKKIYNSLKDIAPPERTTSHLRKHIKLITFILLMLLSFLSILIFYLISNYGYYIINVIMKMIH